QSLLTDVFGSRLLLCTIHQCKNFTMSPRGDGKPCAVYLTGWSGRAPAPPVTEANPGQLRQGARHVSAIQQLRNRRDRHRYWQELVPRRGTRSAWCDRASTEMVAWPGRGATCQPITVPNRHGGLRRCTSSQPQAAAARPQCPADASQIRAAV